MPKQQRFKTKYPGVYFIQGTSSDGRPERIYYIEVVKHSAVASPLGRHFAKTGRLDPKFHRMCLNARRVRETADYGIFARSTDILPPERG
jgi:hypothetical protein